MVNQYWCFVSDYKGIWYRIPVSKRQEFYDLEEYWRKGYEQYNFIACFNEYRCMHPINYMFKIGNIEVLKES